MHTGTLEYAGTLLTIDAPSQAVALVLEIDRAGVNPAAGDAVDVVTCGGASSGSSPQ